MTEPIDLAEEVRRDISRYDQLIDQYRSGDAVVPEHGPRALDGSGGVYEKPRHLENVVRELKALLRDR
jgi:hypothetical protein